MSDESDRTTGDPAHDTDEVPTDADDVPVEAEVIEPDESAEDAATDAADGNADAANGSDPASRSAEDTPVGVLLEELTSERDAYLESLQQLQADFENFRKQAMRRQSEAIEYATGRLVEDLLVVLDACDAGIEHGDEGVVAIYNSLLGVLERAGLERLEPEGEPFDPNAHEAVMHEPGDDDSEGPVVVEVLRPGYRWKERTLRAAMVKVEG